MTIKNEDYHDFIGLVGIFYKAMDLAPLYPELSPDEQRCAELRKYVFEWLENEDKMKANT